LEENLLFVLGSLTDWLITPTKGRKRGQVCCEPTGFGFSKNYPLFIGKLENNIDSGCGVNSACC
jgi:hypothetical protein